ncbi:MAG: UDP-N-acetylmuramoyl-tripeptide--D-alanyl-D-alanine ligase [Chloroflexi bacterium]|nr:UDP-N-acetylmuramoyl-tripeptide--D-alanyl-D-alanine ligase [Chloroflexota bacterium]
MIPLSKVLEGIEDFSLPYRPAPGIKFTGVGNDSRLLQPGSLFVALRGERDGHDFIPGAFARGARGVLAERVIPMEGWLPEDQRVDFAYIVVPNSLEALQKLSTYWLAQHRVDVIGVTGSLGKTSTKEMIATVLEQRFRVLKNEKNLNNEIGLPLTVLNINARHEKVVLEMGMYALGEIAALCHIAKPRVGVVTNVGPTHLERLGTIDRIAQAKSEMIQALPVDGLAILNGDDPRVLAMRALAGCPTMTYGLGDDRDIRATNVVSNGLKGLEFTLIYAGETAEVRTPLLGRHSAYACLAAVAVGIASGMSVGEAAAALARPPSTVRVEVKPGLNGSTVIDDSYNASPLSMIAALSVLAEMPGKKIAVLGDMFELGSYEEQGHREVGEQAAMVADELIVVGQRARWIGDEAVTRGHRKVMFFESTAQVQIQPGAGEFILVKGSRGMRMEEIVGKLLLPAPQGNES